MIAGIATNVLAMMAGLYGLLVLASATTFILRRSNPDKDYTELSQRINSWWLMVTMFTAAIVLSKNVSLVFFAFISFLALKEYFSIIPTRRADRRVLFSGYLSIPPPIFFFLL